MTPTLTLPEAIDAIMSKPHRTDAMGPDFFSCFGVYRYLLAEFRGVELPAETTVKDIAEFFAAHVRVSVFNLEPLDVFYDQIKGEPHVWTVESLRWTVTSYRGRARGVIREQVRGVLRRPGVEAWRYAP